MLHKAIWTCQEKCSQKIPKILERQESGGMMSQPICYNFPAKSVACVLAATVTVEDSSFEPAVLFANW